MRDKEKMKEGEIYGIIDICRKCNLSEESIMKILQEQENLSERSAKIYLEEAEEAIKRINEYRFFIDSLCKIISDLKKINADDGTIILKLQDKFHFDKDDAEFYYDYVMKTHINKIIDNAYVVKTEKAVKKTKENSKCQNESMALLMRDRENRKIGKIFGAISVYKDFHLSDEDIISKLRTKFDLTEEQANAYLAEEE